MKDVYWTMGALDCLRGDTKTQALKRVRGLSEYDEVRKGFEAMEAHLECAALIAKRESRIKEDKSNGVG